MTSSTDAALRLAAPSMEHEREILDYRAETLAADGKHLHGSGGLDNLGVAEWLAHLERKARPETCPEGLVPDSTFLCVRGEDGAVVGMLNIRHTLNDYLLQYGGHIGYSIRPRERGKGYGKEQLRLGLAECKKLGITRALLTCDERNAASRRVIQSCGGVYEDTRTNPDGKRMERWWIVP
ncbi:MAG TPA: GNAT family N-acetyltransferase [Candidatus Limnocylindria bacterium]|nr:GNAT family N-acetyltransferase [Candidatus Limnocylindria bacterium]